MDTLIAPLSGAVHETFVRHAGEGHSDAMRVGSARTPGRLKTVIAYTADRLNAVL